MASRVKKARAKLSVDTPAASTADFLSHAKRQAKRGGGRGGVAAGRGGVPIHLGVYGEAAIDEAASALQADRAGTLFQLPQRGGEAASAEQAGMNTVFHLPLRAPPRGGTMGGGRKYIPDQLMHGATQGAHHPGTESSRDLTAALDAAILSNTSAGDAQPLRNAIAALEQERDNLMAGTDIKTVANPWSRFDPPMKGLTSNERAALLEVGPSFPALRTSKMEVAAAREGASSTLEAGHKTQHDVEMQPPARAATARKKEGAQEWAITAVGLGGVTEQPVAQRPDNTKAAPRQDSVEDGATSMRPTTSLEQAPVETPAAPQFGPHTREHQIEARQAIFRSDRKAKVEKRRNATRLLQQNHLQAWFKHVNDWAKKVESQFKSLWTGRVRTRSIPYRQGLELDGLLPSRTAGLALRFLEAWAWPRIDRELANYKWRRIHFAAWVKATPREWNARCGLRISAQWRLQSAFKNYLALLRYCRIGREIARNRDGWCAQSTLGVWRGWTAEPHTDSDDLEDDCASDDESEVGANGIPEEATSPQAQLSEFRHTPATTPPAGTEAPVAEQVAEPGTSRPEPANQATAVTKPVEQVGTHPQADTTSPLETPQGGAKTQGAACFGPGTLLRLQDTAHKTGIPCPVEKVCLGDGVLVAGNKWGVVTRTYIMAYTGALALFGHSTSVTTWHAVLKSENHWGWAGDCTKRRTASHDGYVYNFDVTIDGVPESVLVLHDGHHMSTMGCFSPRFVAQHEAPALAGHTDGIPSYVRGGDSETRTTWDYAKIRMLEGAVSIPEEQTGEYWIDAQRAMKDTAARSRPDASGAECEETAQVMPQQEPHAWPTLIYAQARPWATWVEALRPDHQASRLQLLAACEANLRRGRDHLAHKLKLLDQEASTVAMSRNIISTYEHQCNHVLPHGILYTLIQDMAHDLQCIRKDLDLVFSSEPDGLDSLCEQLHATLSEHKKRWLADGANPQWAAKVNQVQSRFLQTAHGWAARLQCARGSDGYYLLLQGGMQRGPIGPLAVHLANNVIILLSCIQSMQCLLQDTNLRLPSTKLGDTPALDVLATMAMKLKEDFQLHREYQKYVEAVPDMTTPRWATSTDTGHDSLGGAEVVLGGHRGQQYRDGTDQEPIAEGAMAATQNVPESPPADQRTSSHSAGPYGTDSDVPAAAYAVAVSSADSRSPKKKITKS